MKLSDTIYKLGAEMDSSLFISLNRFQSSRLISFCRFLDGAVTPNRKTATSTMRMSMAIRMPNFLSLASMDLFLFTEMRSALVKVDW